MSRLVEVTELALRDGHQSLLATRMALEDMVGGLRGHRPGRLLERRMLGRGHLRLLHPLPQRGPLGAAAHVPQADAQLPPADAAARARTCWATATTRTRSSTASWTSRPRTAWTSSASSTRSTTSATSSRAMRRRPPHRQARRRGRSATPPRPCTPSRSSSRWPSGSRTWARDSICIKDMAALLQAPAGLRHRQGDQGEVRQGHARPRPRPLHHGRHDGQPDEGDRGGRRHRRHVDLLAQPGPRPQPDRGPGRDARGHGLHHPAEEGPAAQDQGALRQGPAHVRRVRVQVHRGRDRDLRQPDPRRHDLEHGEPAQAAGRRRPASRRCSPRCPGCARPRAIRRWSRRPARSSARRPSSTS